MNLLKIYLLVINGIAFLLFGIDKKKAIHHAYRIPERILILASILGGSYGAWIGMLVFHHKTRKPLFRYAIPFLVVLESVLIFFCFSQNFPQLH